MDQTGLAMLRLNPLDAPWNTATKAVMSLTGIGVLKLTDARLGRLRQQLHGGVHIKIGAYSVDC